MSATMTAPTMRERVARAIADANMEDFDELSELHFAMADAAIRAMREPTAAMAEAGNSYKGYLGHGYDESPDGDHGTWSWRTMIDAALAEKPDGD